MTIAVDDNDHSIKVEFEVGIRTITTQTKEGPVVRQEEVTYLKESFEQCRESGIYKLTGTVNDDYSQLIAMAHKRALDASIDDIRYYKLNDQRQPGGGDTD